jgi:HK97 gp10 family phage protein
MTNIEGLEEVVKRIENMADIDKIKSAMGISCALVEGTAKQNARKDTGALRNSIKSEVKINGNEIKGIIYTPLEYAPYVEFGTGLFAEKGNGRKTGWAYEDEKTGKTIWTRGQRPKPFLRPALFENKNKIIKRLEESVKK